MEYLGSLGRLVSLRCASTERVQAEARYSVRATVEGRRRAQIVPSSPRTWDVSWGAGTNPDIAALSAFVSGGWGAGPWHWVSIQAQRGNLLTPREASLVDRVTRPEWVTGAPEFTVDGWVPSTLVNGMSSGAGSVATYIPVLPEKPVTFAADLLGDGTVAPTLTVAFYDAAGGSVGSGTYLAPVRSGWVRASFTRPVPDGAVHMNLGIGYQTRRMARPQVTWTDGPVPYSAGHGCRAAIVDGWSEDLIVANSYGTYSTAGFTVMEVS